jgi:hypothetical protein
MVVPTEAGARTGTSSGSPKPRAPRPPPGLLGQGGGWSEPWSVPRTRTPQPPQRYQSAPGRAAAGLRARLSSSTGAGWQRYPRGSAGGSAARTTAAGHRRPCRREVRGMPGCGGHQASGPSHTGPSTGKSTRPHAQRVSLKLAGEVAPLGATRPVVGATRPVVGATRPVVGATRPVVGATRPVGRARRGPSSRRTPGPPSAAPPGRAAAAGRCRPSPPSRPCAAGRWTPPPRPAADRG